MLSDKNIDRLEQAVAALNKGDPIPLAALAPLTDLTLADLDVSIDFTARSRLGAPVIVARPRPRKRDLAHLSPRRRSVAVLILDGLSNKAIATELGLAVSTVKDHVHAVLRSCGCASRTELMARFHDTQD